MRQVEDKYHFVNGVSVLPACTANSDPQIYLSGVPRDVMSTTRFEKSRVEAYFTASVEALLVKESAILAAIRRVIRDNAERGQSLFFHVERKEANREIRPRMTSEKREGPPRRKNDGGKKTRAWLREPESRLDFAKSAESSSDSGSACEPRAPVAVGSEYVSNAVAEVTGITTRREDIVAE